MSERLYAAAKAPKRLLRAEGGSHHNLTARFFDEYQRAIAEHFALKLPGNTPAGSPGAGLGSTAQSVAATQ